MAFHPIFNLSILALLLNTTSALAATPYSSVNVTLKQELGNLSLGGNTRASPVMGISKPTIKNGVAYVSASHSLGDWAIGLSPKLPISLTVMSQQGDAVLDLRPLQLSALTITQQLGTLTLMLPAANLNVSLTQSQGDGTITLPPNVGLRLNAKQFTQGTLIMNGKTVAAGLKFDGTYQTANYDSAQYKVNMTVKKQLGTLTIK
ncbi:LiaF-related protein [Deinococcus rubellus]|uniref:Cell wall-active antibiotics response LiaF-like C-terminal domain-containing protein n=1 Tax=Deinococcus rubellus TaxID=1889240 RepID=A0ABY5YDP8_9DEIO|nr:hypothetical protein [Deinococcus rubellus]UWX63200.1 hypothetical protein N0D28_10595 [Deinococcus rubellus]